MSRMLKQQSSEHVRRSGEGMLSRGLQSGQRCGNGVGSKRRSVVWNDQSQEARTPRAGRRMYPGLACTLMCMYHQEDIIMGHRGIHHHRLGWFPIVRGRFDEFPRTRTIQEEAS